jgi:hypothetical protein
MNFVSMAMVIAAIKGGKPRWRIPNNGVAHQQEVIRAGGGR